MKESVSAHLREAKQSCCSRECILKSLSISNFCVLRPLLWSRSREVRKYL